MHRSLRAACALVACAAGLATSATAGSANTLDIVIAGDSYSSGVGASGSTFGGTCVRSNATWGAVYGQLARAKGLSVNVNNVACAGGVVKDLYGQINAVNADTDLVLVTIGGNDVGFANIVVQCFTPLIADPYRCRDSIWSGKAKVPAVQTAALAALKALKAKLHPGAKVIVMSYPYLANPSNYILRSLNGQYNSGQAARELGDLGDQAVINAANLANVDAGYELVKFIPIKDRFVGHEPNQNPYADNPQRWVNEFDLSGPYHPNRTGYAVMAKAVLDNAGPTFDFGASQ
jgi:lysophospholipase L1-like esterase